MADLYFTEAGDIVRAPDGDFALTPTVWREDAQQGYIRAMTDQGDFTIYPTLGASLSTLYGLPQSPETGKYGEKLIESALEREGRFAGKAFTVTAIPTGYQRIRFDIQITSGNREAIKLSVEQDLGLDSQ
ncbi:MAG TPA: hypothetical protein VJ742_12175 [Nitrososphaera sp.]|nr:hypothetical protein [Nitrososphaera sp.]